MQALPYNRFLLAHQAHRSYVANIPQGVPIEAVLEPKFWQYFARSLKINDRIEVIAEDGAFDGDLRVTAVSEFGIQVRVLRMVTKDDEVDVGPINGSLLADAQIGWGGRHKWRITLPDGTIVSKDHPNQEAAAEELDRLKQAA